MSRYLKLLFVSLLLCLLPPVPAGNSQSFLTGQMASPNTRPASVEEISRLIADHAGSISIGGARYSQGGQTTCDGCLFLDMSGMNRILNIDTDHRTITVEAGITWRQIQERVAPLGLAPRIMQSYANFSVGGSLSVNAHGRYAGEGPIITSVRSIRLVLADGSVVAASRDSNRDLFDAAIGGYGGIGVIVEATLDLAPDRKLEKIVQRIRATDYPVFYDTHVADHAEVVLHTALLYPSDYRMMTVTTASKTDHDLTIPDPLRPLRPATDKEISQQHFLAYSYFGKWYREHIYDPRHNQPSVVMRNYEVADTVESIAPPKPGSRFMLQEYFVPVDHFNTFIPAMRRVFHRHHVNVVTLSVRRAKADTESLLSWAKTDVYAFVIYYEQPATSLAETREKLWTQEMLDLTIQNGGSWYLPYKILGTREQFLAAYPKAAEFFAIKHRVDPTNKFRNHLWDAYDRP